MRPIAIITTSLFVVIFCFVFVVAPTLRSACVGLMKYRAFGTRLVRVHHMFPIGIGNPLRLVRLTVEIHHHGVAQRLDLARFGILQALLHLEAGVAHLCDAALADNRVVETHGFAEIQVHMDKDVFKSKPIDMGLKNMLEVSASTHVEKIALRPVIDVVVRVEVAHADLNGTREHRLLISSQNAESAAT